MTLSALIIRPSRIFIIIVAFASTLSYPRIRYHHRSQAYSLGQIIDCPLVLPNEPAPPTIIANQNFIFLSYLQNDRFRFLGRITLR
ncbi:hypothetical protein BC943DRAFT_132521 [Umbelopsis sp. AD052]|nr:hypothetical protein BC943DRAFT_132521 [Umbelopsis sp. AD052]